jgi:hypothetical protein
MAHKKLYYVLCALVVVIVFGTAAICNMCGTGAAATDKTGTDGETAAVSTAKPGSGTTEKDSSSESTAKTSDTVATDTSAESVTAAESTAAGGTAPTIKLEIYEGPTYSAGDDICFYRIKATVTGNPAPTVKFSKDDSSGAWGSKKVQVNIHRGQPYTLTATAKNSAGEASASINLTWGCGEENRVPVINDITLSSASIKTGQQYDVTGNTSDPDGDAMAYKWTVNSGTINTADTVNPMKWTAPAAAGPATITLKVADGKGGEASMSKVVDVVSAVTSLNVPKKTNEGGYIESGGPAYAGGDIFVGDSVGNKPVRGFVSFDISTLAGKTIDSASVTFSLKETWGTAGIFGVLWVGVVDWGAEPIVLADYLLGGIGIQSFDPAAGGSFTCSAESLKTQLQNAITAGKSRFQIRIHWGSEGTNSNGAWDGWEYDQSAGVNLNITYH